VDQRIAFIMATQQRLYPVTELCARFGISRKTGDKWLARFAAGGRAALADQSRAPHHCPHRIPPVLAERLCTTRRQHPDWGARKLLAYLARREPEPLWPAVSTVNDLLSRQGLLVPRRRRRPRQHPGGAPPLAHAPNDLWTADFKGQFPTGDGRLCYPLTIADHHSRYLLSCQGLRSTHGQGARLVFERVFQTYGLPRVIRTDNGSPFASTGLQGLSRLNVWWMRLGIQHQRIQPGRPQQNGAHERLHRTLKRGAIRPPRANLAAQQRAFNRFRTEYNDARPHEALGNGTPASRYRPSPRPFPRGLPPQEYPGHFLVKKITTAGTFWFQHRLLFLASSLTGHHVGLEETDNGIWSIYFNTVLLAKLNERDYTIRG
jgi:transposase InsO family protein